jgi:hypothetical protein
MLGILRFLSHVVTRMVRPVEFYSLKNFIRDWLNENWQKMIFPALKQLASEEFTLRYDVARHSYTAYVEAAKELEHLSKTYGLAPSDIPHILEWAPSYPHLPSEDEQEYDE